MRVLLLVFVLLSSLLANEDEFVVGTTSGGTSKSSYFNSLNMPDVYVSTECKKKCSGDGCCWRVIRNQTGNIIRSFSSSDSVDAVSNGRYKDMAYLLYARTYGPDKDRKTKYYLVDQNHKQYDVPAGSSGMANIISKNRELISVHKDGVYKNGTQILSNDAIETATISNNPNGNIAIAAALELSDEVIVSNLTKWVNTGIVLAKHGDRTGILSVYPESKNDIYTAVYKNVNIYNKGITGAYVDFSSESSKHGWVFNSAQRNVGFDPNMYVHNDTVYIGTKDTTNRNNISVVASSSEYKNLGQDIPKHIEGFEDESMVELLVGAGLSQTYWYASSSIDDVSSDSDMEYGEVEYDIGSSLYESVYFEGRIGTNRLSISYLQNQAEDVGGLTAKVSKIVNVLFDFDGLISDSSTLRLKMLKGNVNGVAEFKDKNNGSTSITTELDELTTEFESEVVTYGAYVMFERGYFGGLEYTDYTTPSAVGFSDSSKTVRYYGMDPEFGISTYSLVVGYDEISYAKRYEVDLSRWYIQGMAGIGWANYNLSSEIEQKVESQNGGYSINYTGSLAFNGEVEFGYIYQQRFKMFRGLGYSVTAGYRARGSYNGSGQSEDSENDIEADELELEMTRYDIWHGPFVSANIVF
jgi:hypothetical protein